MGKKVNVCKFSFDNNLKMAIGKVVSYNSKRNFGFILEEDSKNTIFFFYDKNKLRKQKLFDEIRPEFLVNDIVEFDVVYNEEKERIAKNVRYLKNDFVDDLLNRYEFRNEFEGFLKVINEDQILIKEKVSKIKIKLSLNFWEDIEYYKNHNNQLFNFQLKKIKKNKSRARIRLLAELTNKKIQAKYLKLIDVFENDKIMTGKVNRENDRGLFILINKPEFPDLNFYVKKQDRSFFYKENQIISFKIINIGKSKNISGLLIE